MKRRNFLSWICAIAAAPFLPKAKAADELVYRAKVDPKDLKDIESSIRNAVAPKYKSIPINTVSIGGKPCWDGDFEVDWSAADPLLSQKFNHLVSHPRSPWTPLHLPSMPLVEGTFIMRRSEFAELLKDGNIHAVADLVMTANESPGIRVGVVAMESDAKVINFASEGFICVFVNTSLSPRSNDPAAANRTMGDCLIGESASHKEYAGLWPVASESATWISNMDGARTIV